MAKDTKTNAMRILDREKVSYKVNLYECDEFVDGVSVADMLGRSQQLCGRRRDGRAARRQDDQVHRQLYRVHAQAHRGF